MIQKRIVLSFAGIVALGLLLIAFSLYSNKPIETVSANVAINTEQILANFNGKIKSLNYKTYDDIKTGDIVATIEVTQTESNCNNPKAMQNKQKQAMAEYENAAIMYKDGVISQQQYDSSLEKLRKTQDQKACGGEATHIENIYAFKNGKIFYNEYKVGDEVQEDDVLAEIGVTKPQIHAYFSPKKAKRIKVDMPAEITIIKYPEKLFTGVVRNTDAVDIMGRLIILDIAEDLNDINIQSGDAAVVKIKP